MIRWLLHKMTKQFEQRYHYDAGYMHDVFDISTGAGVRLSLLPMLSQYQGPNTDLWAGAALASMLDGDCGPCAQLVVDMAVEAGANAEDIKTCIEGAAQTSNATGLGFLFAQAIIRDDANAETLREQIISRYGDEANVAATFAAATSRAYPVIKRGLGHGASCQKLTVGSYRDIAVAHAA